MGKSISIGRYVGTVILIIIFLSIMAGLYPVINLQIALALNVSVYSGTESSGVVAYGLLTTLDIIYWIFVGIVAILIFLKGFNLEITDQIKNY